MCLNHTKKEKEGYCIFNTSKKKYGGCWISNPGVLLPWTLTRTFTFQRENWNYFIVWTDDDNCWVFFIVTSVLKSSLKYLNLLQHFIILLCSSSVIHMHYWPSLASHQYGWLLAKCPFVFLLTKTNIVEVNKNAEKNEAEH